MLRSDSTYTPAGFLDPDAMFALALEILAAGRQRSYSLTRLVAHADYATTSDRGALAFIMYEARLNKVLPLFPDAVICAYDLRRISARMALDVLRTLPMAIAGGVLQENPFFVPPDTLLRELAQRGGAAPLALPNA